MHVSLTRFARLVSRTRRKEQVLRRWGSGWARRCGIIFGKRNSQKQEWGTTGGWPSHVNWPLSAGTRVASFLLVTPFFNFKDTVLQLDGSSAHVHYLDDNEIYAAPLYCFCIPRVCPPSPPRPVSPFPQGPVYLPATEPTPTRKSIHFNPQTVSPTLWGLQVSGGSIPEAVIDSARPMLTVQSYQDLGEHQSSTICSGESADALGIGLLSRIIAIILHFRCDLIRCRHPAEDTPAPCSLHISRSDPPAPSPHLSSIRGGRSFRDAV
jgi:hypothetical protein